MAHFPELLNALALAPKPRRTPRFPTKLAPTSSLCCHGANTSPGAEQTSLGSRTIRGWKRSCATSAQTFGPIADATSQSCSKKTLKPVQTFFLKWTQSFLNPDSARISSLWTTHLRNMCRNLTNKTKEEQKGKC